MKSHLTVLSLLAVLPFAACGMTGNDAAPTKSVAAGAMGKTDVNKLLAGITDAKTAEAAKGPLDAVVASLKGLAGGAVADASTGAKKLSADTLAKYGITGETMGLISGLLATPAVSSLIGPTLNQLKGLIGM